MSDQGHNSNVELDIDELLSFLNELDDKKLTVNEANGTLRSRIKEILGERDWNKGAFADIRKIHAMSETARADYLRTFSVLFDGMMSEFWETEMRDLLDQLEAEAAE